MIDHIVFITKMVQVMFQETVSQKLLGFTLYVYLYILLNKSLARVYKKYFFI